MILDKIINQKKKRIFESKQILSQKEVVKLIDKKIPPSFKDSILKIDNISIIAEIKKASPSKGIICDDFKPLEIAQSYQNAGVSAISVLTEQDFFMGSNDYMRALSMSTDVPLLRKDFIIDEYQIYEARLIGASAILLITSILTDYEIKTFMHIAKGLGLDCLVEVHNVIEAQRANFLGCEIIGINNRDLKTFKTDLYTTELLLPYIENAKVTVSESGILTSQDYQYLKSLNVNAMLIGEAFMKAKNIENAIEELIYGENQNLRYQI